MSPAIDAAIQTIVPMVKAVTFPVRSVQPINLNTSPVPNSVTITMPDVGLDETPIIPTMREKEVESALAREGINVDILFSLNEGENDASGRTIHFVIDSLNGTFNVAGNMFRLAVGPQEMRSTKLKMITREKIQARALEILLKEIKKFTEYLEDGGDPDEYDRKQILVKP